jgi:5-(carboxyamino)imidazole ribonucleotide mutase
VTSRTPSEWAGLAAAFVVGGAAVAFGVVLIASMLGLPIWAGTAVAVVGVAAIAYPVFRSPERPVDPQTPHATPAAPANDEAPATPSNVRTPVSDTPLVGIIMGSQSDMAVMEECAKALEGFGVPYEVLVASAHRQPAKVHEWASGLAERGVKVVIAAAGKAAHLGGVVAAYTPLPVIAVPMKTSDLGGLDSLLSMVQMPSGVPVACVAINGAKNAAILATQVLGTSMPEYRAAVERMKSDLAL